MQHAILKMRGSFCSPGIQGSVPGMPPAFGISGNEDGKSTPRQRDNNAYLYEAGAAQAGVAINRIWKV